MCVPLDQVSLFSNILNHVALSVFILLDNLSFRSHKEMTLWKEKQIQVAKEELRIRESLSRIKQNDDAKKAASKEWQIQQKV